MKIKRINSTQSHPRVLSTGKNSVLGSYDFNTTLVCLESLSKEDLEEMIKHLHAFNLEKKPLSYEAYETLSKIQPLVVHEYTHFFDCTSTVWGAKYLSMMAKAYEADNLNYGGIEKDFHYAKRFYDLLKFLRLPEYFTEKTEAIDNVRPWLYQETMGNRFLSSGQTSNHPIMFIRFLNEDSELLVRSPISTISLLECTAMAQEIDKTIQLIQLSSEPSKTIEAKRYNKKIFDYIYNREITEYSVCAHLMANQYSEPDIHLTYQASALLCRMVLNTPSSIYLQIVEEFNFGSLFSSLPWITKIKLGLDYLDCGILYYLVCKAMPKGKLENLDSMFSLILGAYNRLGVSYEHLKAESEKEFLEYSHAAATSKISSISKIAKAGQKNYSLTDWNKVRLDFHLLSLPPALLGDSNQAHFFPRDENSLDLGDIEQIYNELVTGQLWTERFAEACN